MSAAEPVLQRVGGDGSGVMFDRIARRYDLLNRIISLGIDQRWRRRALRALELPQGARVLDLATGTADLAMQLARSFPDATVVGLDPSRGMLAVGDEKLRRAGLADRVTLVHGDAQALPFAPQSFDAATMAFGIRNVPDRDAALRELARVLRPGGRVSVLELAEPRAGLLGALARVHVHHVVPWLGALLSGAHEYRYLQRSIAAFPAPEAFAERFVAAGLRVRAVEPLTFGVATLFVAEAPRG